MSDDEEKRVAAVLAEIAYCCSVAVREFCASPPPDTRAIYDEKGNLIRIEVRK